METAGSHPDPAWVCSRVENSTARVGVGGGAWGMGRNAMGWAGGHGQRLTQQQLCPWKMGTPTACSESKGWVAPAAC